VKTVLYVSPRIFTHKNSTGISIGFFREIPETFFVALQSISQSFYLRHQNVYMRHRSTPADDTGQEISK